ncbi:MAG: hypothetical protein J1E05_08215, partial [Eubacterium sp.]|nr:hypothetical protein [Eubacterium sp.]
MNAKNKFTCFLALLLCACMIFSTFSVTVYAESDSTTRWTPTGSDSNVKYLSDMEIIDVLNNDDTSTKTNTSYVESGHQIRKDKNDQSKLITLLI